jgi:hypothetical protein
MNLTYRILRLIEETRYWSQHSADILLERNVLEDLFNKVPPKTLNHYTSANGFLGIISSKTLWLTNIHYLNDNQEFKLAVDVANFLVEKGIEFFPEYKDLFNIMKAVVNSVK